MLLLGKGGGRGWGGGRGGEGREGGGVAERGGEEGWLFFSVFFFFCLSISSFFLSFFLSFRQLFRGVFTCAGFGVSKHLIHAIGDGSRVMFWLLVLSSTA